tara:strand:+ start:44 stop:748 length:705 start_codon:yes stop_codon:yes gene_type:complete
MSLIALIPARGGSKGIPRKNIKSFCGKPLIYWSIKVALENKLIDRVIVSTEDKEIAQIAKDFSAEVPFLRSEALANDDSLTIDVVLNILEKLDDVTDILLLQPTSPLRRIEDLSSIFELRKKCSSDSAVSVCQSEKNLALYQEIDPKRRLKPLLKGEKILPRQFSKMKYLINGSMYLSSKESIIKNKSLITSNTVGYIMPEIFSIDIDNQLDWDIGEFLMKKNMKKIFSNNNVA